MFRSAGIVSVRHFFSVDTHICLRPIRSFQTHAVKSTKLPLFHFIFTHGATAFIYCHFSLQFFLPHLYWGTAHFPTCFFLFGSLVSVHKQYLFRCVSLTPPAPSNCFISFPFHFTHLDSICYFALVCLSVGRRRYVVPFIFITISNIYANRCRVEEKMHPPHTFAIKIYFHFAAFK